LPPAPRPRSSLSSSFLSSSLLSSSLASLSLRGPGGSGGPRPPVRRSSCLSPAEAWPGLTDATDAGQSARRRALLGKCVAFISAGYSGKRFIYEKAKELGVRAVIVDGTDSWSRALVADGVAERFVAVDMSDAEGVLPSIVEALRGLEAEGVPVDGVCTFCEVAVPLVARVAEALGLPGNSVAAVDSARDKHATRAAMALAGLPTPANVLLPPGSDAAAVAAAGDTVGFPAVLKPTGGAASIGVLRVNDGAQLAAGYARVVEEMSRSVVNSCGALVQLPPGAPLPEGARHLVSAMLLEEYLDGTEIDCDVVLDGGVPTYARVTDNWPTHEPWFNETGDNCPSALPLPQQTAMAKLCTDTLAALGFTCGVFHVEGKVTSRGPRLIEVNARMGGGQVRDNNLAVWGVDLVEERILTAVGLPARPAAAEPPLTCRSTLYINAPRSGVMGDGDWMAAVRAWPRVVYARIFSASGDAVVCAADGLPTWIGQIMCDGDTIEDAVALVNKADAAAQPRILDAPPH
jgi:carnosine synthase